jgi:hypothetical protein
MGFMSIAKPFAFFLFADSGTLFERRVALGSARESSFGPLRGPAAGFRRLGGRAQVRQKPRNYAMDSDRRQAAGVLATLPR